MGILQLGFIAIYLSEPLTRGLTTGAACHVFTSQIKDVFGLTIPKHSGPLKLYYVSYYNYTLSVPRDSGPLKLYYVSYYSFTLSGSRHSDPLKLYFLS